MHSFNYFHYAFDYLKYLDVLMDNDGAFDPYYPDLYPDELENIGLYQFRLKVCFLRRDIRSLLSEASLSIAFPDGSYYAIPQDILDNLTFDNQRIYLKNVLLRHSPFPIDLYD